MILVYEVTEMNEDGRAKLCSTLFSTKTAAEDYSKKLGAYSGGITTLEVFESTTDFSKNNRELRRQRALDKLTDDDKFVLGLSCTM